MWQALSGQGVLVYPLAESRRSFSSKSNEKHAFLFHQKTFCLEMMESTCSMAGLGGQI